MPLSFPFLPDARGRSAESDADGHIRDMIEQVLFTSPGERVNRPDFGCGLLQLVFAPNSDALAAAVRLTVGASLQQWLGELIEVGDLDVANDDATLTVTVSYVVRGDDESLVATFTKVLT
jgi:phage baseplate assembly protein W